MNSNWQTLQLKDVLDKKGYIRGPFGSALKRGELLDEGIPVYEQSNAINDDRFFRYFISEEKYNSLKRFTVKPNDLVISCSGTVGRVTLIKENDPVGIISQALLILRPNDKIILPKFLYYFFLTARGHNSILERSGGSVQVNIARREIIEAIQIDIPPIDVQKKIVNTLSKIDNKIHLNESINKQLLDICSLLYKETTKSSPFRKLGDIIKYLESGKRPKGGAEEIGVPSIGAEKIERIGIYDFSSEKFISHEYFKTLKKGIVNSGDVLLYKDGAYTGKVSMALDGFPHKECAVNEHVFIVRTENLLYQNFLYFTLADEIVRQKVYSLASSKAAQPGLNKQELLSVNARIPPVKQIELFCNKVAPIMHEIIRNAFENKKLLEMRDLILPKLLFKQ